MSSLLGNIEFRASELIELKFDLGAIQIIRDSLLPNLGVPYVSFGDIGTDPPPRSAGRPASRVLKNNNKLLP